MGYNAYGQLGLGHYDTKVFVPRRLDWFIIHRVVPDSISLGGTSSYIVAGNTGHVYTFGDDAQGQLALCKSINTIPLFVKALKRGLR